MKPSKLMFLAILLVWPFLFAMPCLGLQPDELLVVANRNARGSIDIAKMYMQKRHVPEENLLRLFVTDKESCSRDDYEKKIAGPIREKLAEYPLADRPRCIVTVKGVPLKAGAGEHKGVAS